MIKWGKGWALTRTGLKFEERVSFEDSIRKVEGYSIRNIAEYNDAYEIFYHDTKVAETYKKTGLYGWLKWTHNVNYQEIISKKLLPDNAIYVIANETLFIIEIKFQKVAWSVDEKLQTCDFKNLQYQRLFASTGITVKYCYVLNDWFCKKEYIDVLNYIQAKDCFYFFGELPLDFLGLPAPTE